MDKYKMGGHKLLWHLDRVQAWQKGERIAPLSIDVGLSKGCNIRCEYCFGQMQGTGYKDKANVVFPREALLNYVRDAGTMGVRSMALIGEGEPTLNPAIYDAIIEGKKAGVDMSLGTNGILFDKGTKGEEALRNLTWIRFNISAASKEAYRRVHNSDMFDTVIDKISFCVETKRKYDLNVTIGLQMVLTPGNVDQVVALAQLGAKLGVDYFVVKQCSDVQDNTLGVYEQLGEYKNFSDLLQAAERESTEHYNVIIKWQHITNEGKRNYKKCLGAPFFLYSSGDGRLYPCGMFFDKYEEEYRLGDLTKQSFIEIVNSDRYWDVMRKVAEIDVSTCYSNCRTNMINEFAWQLKNPPEHINFI